MYDIEIKIKIESGCAVSVDSPAELAKIDGNEDCMEYFCRF